MKHFDKKQSRTTGIEWCSHTWNPFVGCSMKSAGCQNCYAMSLAKKLDKWGQKAYSGTWRERGGKVTWTGKINKNTRSAFEKPLRIRQSSVIFVNSMSDFFHEGASNELRLEALEVMHNCPGHQFQVLTKRPENILKFVKETGYKFPDNVWLGATVEDNRVKERVKHLRKVKAAIKFLSIEPLIGDIPSIDLRGIDWVISGGESGPGARPMKYEWLCHVHEATRKYDVAHFFKQYGKPQNNPLWDKTPKGRTPAAFVKEKDPVGKGGSKLLGKYWKEMPRGFKTAKIENL